MGNWLVNHWFSAAVLVSVWGWGLTGVACCGGTRGATGPGGLVGEVGTDALPWGWAVGRDKHPLCSADPRTPAARGGVGSGKLKSCGKQGSL